MIRTLMVVLACVALNACAQTRDGRHILSPNGAGLVVGFETNIPSNKACLRAPNFTAQVACEKGRVYQRDQVLREVQEVHREEERQAFERGAELAWRRADGVGYRYVDLMQRCEAEKTKAEYRACKDGIRAGNSAVAIAKEESERRDNEYWFHQGQRTVGTVSRRY